MFRIAERQYAAGTSGNIPLQMFSHIRNIAVCTASAASSGEPVMASAAAYILALQGRILSVKYFLGAISIIRSISQ